MKFRVVFLIPTLTIFDIPIVLTCATSFAGTNASGGDAFQNESRSGFIVRAWNVTNNVHFAWNSSTRSLRNQMKELPQYHQNQCSDIVHMPNYPGKMLVAHKGLVETILDAYRNHHRLVLRPDDLWAAIMTQFSFYLNGQESLLRNKVILNDMTDMINLNFTNSSGNDSYTKILKTVANQMNNHFKDRQLKNWVLPNFSTTNENDIVTVAAILMATSKKYFSYQLAMSCGIPEITVQGTTEDWRRLRRKLIKLKDYDLEWWHAMLKPVAQQFMNVTRGIVDTPFWRRIIHYERGGANPSYISGWITVFCVFDENGKRIVSDMTPSRLGDGRWDDLFQSWLRMDISNLPSGVVAVDIKTNETSRVLIAGHLATEIFNDGLSVRPKLGWAVAKRGS